MGFGDYVRGLREDQGLDLRSLGIKTAINPSTIQKIESGATASPSLDTLVKLSRVLMIDPQKTYSLLSDGKLQIIPEDKGFINKNLSDAFEKKFQKSSYDGCSLFSTWLTLIYEYKNYTHPEMDIDVYKVIEQQATFTPQLIYMIFLKSPVYSFSINYPKNLEIKNIFDSYMNGELLLWEDVVRYSEQKHKNIDSTLDPKLIISSNDALRKLGANRFVSKCNIMDIIDLDKVTADHGEIFLMSWQLAEIEVEWNQWKDHKAAKLLITIDRWLSHLNIDKVSWQKSIIDYLDTPKGN